MKNFYAQRRQRQCSYKHIKTLDDIVKSGDSNALRGLLSELGSPGAAHLIFGRYLLEYVVFAAALGHLDILRVFRREWDVTAETLRSEWDEVFKEEYPTHLIEVVSSNGNLDSLDVIRQEWGCADIGGRGGANGLSSKDVCNDTGSGLDGGPILSAVQFRKHPKILESLRDDWKANLTDKTFQHICKHLRYNNQEAIDLIMQYWPDVEEDQEEKRKVKKQKEWQRWLAPRAWAHSRRRDLPRVEIVKTFPWLDHYY